MKLKAKVLSEWKNNSADAKEMLMECGFFEATDDYISASLEPFIWFGDAGPDTYNALWNIHPEMAEYYLGFWFSEDPLRYIVE